MMAVMYLNTSNHSKFKWIKFTNQKAQSGQMDKQKRPNYIPPKELHFSSKGKCRRGSKMAAE